MQKINLYDTIAAISTPLGQGGIGIVRLSGKKAFSIADKIFLAQNKKKPSEFKSHTVHCGWIVKRKQKTENRKQNKAEIIDEALVTVMHAPKSYTKEDIVEISSHGGVVSLRSILDLALDSGARLAEPGEFTKRAFLNGRLDLTQAEAVLDIIQSKTEAFLRVSTHQLKGELTTELEAIREVLMEIYTQIEAALNFPEDDIEESTRIQLSKSFQTALGRVEKLLESSHHGKILKEGIKVVICGKANVGKSSLLNVLLKQPRAIVTEVAGTTRDTIEETVQIKGIPFQLVDTAGLLTPRDLIEKEAIRRTHMHRESADLILLMLDGNTKLSSQDKALMKSVKGRNVLIVINKIDLPQKIEEKKVREEFTDKKVLYISALKKKGIGALQDAIADNVWHGHAADTQGVLISNVRHIQSLKACREALKKSIEALSGELPLEFVSEENKQAINHLDNITGRNIDSDLLDKIFSQFCIGK